MATITVGGEGRNVGKTTLVCGLIRALPEFGWVAVKITSHAHGGEAVFEEKREGAGEPGTAGWGELARSKPRTDTERYLAAGARRALLVTAGAGSIAEALAPVIAPGENVVYESNRMVREVRTDLVLAIAGGAEAKPSFGALLEAADAVMLREGSVAGATRPGLPVWALEDFEALPAELIAWVRERLAEEGVGPFMS